MKKVLTSLLLCVLPILMVAQVNYGNEWINFGADPYSNQYYYKIRIGKEGIYRIYRSDLLNWGVNFPTNIDPRSFQIYSRGEEQAIYVEGESDSVFDNTDFIEFYAQPNDGYFDTQMYKNDAGTLDSNAQGSPYYSLFSDSSTYFFTWRLDGSFGLRVTLENDVNFSSYTASPYFTNQKIVTYTTQEYYKGTIFSYKGSDVDYTTGEGWFSTHFDIGLANNNSINTPNVYTLDPSLKAKVSTAVVGASNDVSISNGDHHLKISVGPTTYIDTIYEGYILTRYNFDVNLSDLSSTTAVNFQAFNSVDRNAVCYISLEYPQSFDLNAASTHKMIISDGSGGKSFLDISNFNGGVDPPILWDITNKKRILVVANGANYNALVPNSGGNKICYISSTSEVQLNVITNLVPVRVDPDPGKHAKFYNFEVQPLDSAYIIVTHKSLWSSAGNYENYRKINFNVLMADIDELYDQFAHGITQHPLSIRNFAKYLLDKWPTPPHYLFLLGKSISMGRDNILNLVPTYGVPPADNLLTAGLAGTLYEPAIPTGRLSAKNETDVDSYLDKVKEYESNTPAEWMKKILHFGGGSTDSERAAFASYLSAYEDTIEDSLFGGFVHTFLKNSPDPIQIAQSDALIELVDSGVSIVTFFGHASKNSFDMGLDEPSAYNNKGRYPLFISNSCYSGDIHAAYVVASPSLSSSEDFVLIADKGSIGFLATPSIGLADPSNAYSKELYSKIGKDLYGQSIGRCMKATVLDVQMGSLDTAYKKSVCLEMTLHGDPAIIINSHEKPDLTISSSDVYFTPTDITTEQTTFQTNIICTNIGRTFNDSFYVKVTRVFPDGTTEIYSYKKSGVYFKDTLTIDMPVDFKSPGLNMFSVVLDDSSTIAELSELNNTVGDIPLYIRADDIVPVYPYKYAIVSTTEVTLKASTSDPFATAKTYLFEIDTTDAFNSPLKMDTAITQAGGVLSWNPNIVIPAITDDSTVYFWRVCLQDSLKWKESSFTYVPYKRGWSQAHFHQFLKGDTYQYVDTNKTSRQFDFIDEIYELEVNTYNPLYYPGTASFPHSDIACYLNNQSLRAGAGCIAAGGNSQGAYVVVINPYTAEVLQSPPDQTSGFSGAYLIVQCAGVPMNTWEFSTSTATYRDSMEAFLNSIPDGHFILIYSWKDMNSTAFSPSLKQLFKDIGGDSIDFLKPGYPYILFGKKNTPSEPSYEVLANDSSQALNLNIQFTVKWIAGTITSEVIGPASEWTSLHWRKGFHPTESSFNPRDSIYIDVIGINNNNEDTLLMSALSDFDVSLSPIDADDYPYLKLRAYVADDSLRTPPQLIKWQIYYEGVPEVALKSYTFYGETMAEGDSIQFSTVIENISDYNIDSISVDMWIYDKNRIKHPISYDRKKPLLANGDTMFANISVSSVGYSGANSFWVEANPFNSSHKLEQYHFNNLGEKKFQVDKDMENPLLDVTFDGVHILNGDIISAKPNIVIKLNDENQYLALNDTSLFVVRITNPSNVISNLYFCSNANEKCESRMTWAPADLPKNSFSIEYNPIFSEDGIYELSVQATDKSKNQAGRIDYKITFEVINKSTITEILNYPNPFSTSTRFVFTLTGSEIPTYMKIQIMTISGKVVREITMDELGTIRVGRNITEYAWDGRDKFGDQLANGLYLYKVITSINGSEIEKRTTEADKYFVKGWGKMYLLR